jgi:hypothetical protein
MNNETMSEWEKAYYINPQTLITKVLIVHVMDIISGFFTYLYPREESTAIARQQ